MPRVAVITAVHNGERFIAETVRSVRAQTYHDYEHIVVDDGSTDASMAALGPYAGGLRIIQQVNQGQAHARNRALGATDAELIAVLDADDVWEPSKLQEQVQRFDASPSLGLVATAHLMIDEAGRPLRRQPRIHRDPDLMPYVLTMRVPIAFSSILLRRALLTSDVLHDPRFLHTGELDLYLRLLRGGAGFRNVPRRLVRYRVHGRMLTTVARDSDTYFTEIGQFIEEAFGDPVVAGRYGRLRRLAEAYARYFKARIELSREGDRGAARRDLVRALRHSQSPELLARVAKYLIVSFLPR